MKRLFSAKLIAALSVAAAVLTGCTTGTEETLQYVNLSQVSCSFLGEGNQPLVIEVKASPATWEATPGATWVKVERTDDRTLTVTVDDNDTGAERSTTIAIVAD
ncbi:MAG: BACON domain-containing protein [Tidjanibacter sp.]|nr:BACON domain-containing protein [Tidjanibacter sp.]